MMTPEFLLSRFLFIVVFAGGYLLLTHGIEHRYSKLVSVPCLAVLLLLTYLVDDSSFFWSMFRYVLFAVIYYAWSLLFLKIKPPFTITPT